MTLGIGFACPEGVLLLTHTESSNARKVLVRVA